MTASTRRSSRMASRQGRSSVLPICLLAVDTGRTIPTKASQAGKATSTYAEMRTSPVLSATLHHRHWVQRQIAWI